MTVHFTRWVEEPRSAQLGFKSLPYCYCATSSFLASK